MHHALCTHASTHNTNPRILLWPLAYALADTMARIGWNNTGEHQYIWGDDGYMALVLPSRMVVAGESPDSHRSCHHEQLVLVEYLLARIEVKAAHLNAL